MISGPLRDPPVEAKRIHTRYVVGNVPAFYFVCVATLRLDNVAVRFLLLGRSRFIAMLPIAIESRYIWGRVQ
jgi:hypothetical protein